MTGDNETHISKIDRKSLGVMRECSYLSAYEWLYEHFVGRVELAGKNPQ